MFWRVYSFADPPFKFPTDLAKYVRIQIRGCLEYIFKTKMCTTLEGKIKFQSLAYPQDFFTDYLQTSCKYITSKRFDLETVAVMNTN